MFASRSHGHSWGLRAHRLNLQSLHVRCFSVPRVLLVAVCLAGRLPHVEHSGDLVEQAGQACEPFVVEQAYADAHPQVIFSSKHWRRSRRLCKTCRSVMCAINM